MALPTLATPIGGRGIPIEEGTHGYIRTLEEFPAFLRSVLHHLEQHQPVGLQGRRLIEQKFDWSLIGDQLIEAYKRLEQ